VIFMFAFVLPYIKRNFNLWVLSTVNNDNISLVYQSFHKSTIVL